MSSSQLHECQELSKAMAYSEAIHKLQMFLRTLRLKHTPSAVVLRAPSASIQKIDNNHAAPFSEELLNELKLEKEVNELINIYQVAKEESFSESVSGHRKRLQQAIDSFSQNSDESEVQLRQELKESKNELKSLQEEIRTQHEKAEQRLKCADERIAELRHQRRFVRRINDLEFDLVVKWEEGRASQATIFYEKQEEALLSQIRQLQRKIDGEQRLICEVETFRSRQIEELQQQLAHWQQKYACELAKMEDRQISLQQRIQQLKEKHKRHRCICEEWARKVKEYLQQKAEEQRLLELQMCRVECAVRIQAWWRGVMVRQCLGPFKKKKVKKPKKSQAKDQKQQRKENKVICRK